MSRAGPFAISTVTVMELAKGLEKAGRADTLEPLLARLGKVQVFPFGEAEARRAGGIYGALERLGTPIGRADPMIAATALVHGLTLVTGNVEHYERIAKLGHPLRIENWRDG